MDAALFEILGLPISSITIVDLKFQRWGRDWYLDCIYAEHGVGKNSRLP